MKKLAVSILLSAFVNSAFALNAEIDLPVPSGQTMNVAEALSASDKALSAFTDNRLRKTGAGTLIGDAVIRTEGNVKGVTVAEGIFKFKSNNELGLTLYGGYDWLEVKSGATARFMTSQSDSLIVNRMIYVNGTGVAGQGGAIVAEGACNMSSAQYRIYSDATFYAEGDGECYLLGSTGGNGNCDFENNTLTLKAKEPTASYCITSGFQFRGRGCLCVDGTAFGEKTTGSSYAERGKGEKNNGPYMTLQLKNGATFKPRGQKVVSLFDAIKAEGGTAIAGGAGGSAAFGMTIGQFSGASEVTGLTSLTITNGYTVSVADACVGSALEVDGDLVFAAGTTLAIDGNLDDLIETAKAADGQRVKIATATGTLSGLPSWQQTRAQRNWKLARSADGKSIELVYNVLPVSVADVKAGKILNVDGDLAFDDRAEVIVDGNLDDLTALAVAAADRRLTIATATGTITRLPVWKKTCATRHWTLELAADGKSLAFVYDSLKIQANHIDAVAEWGIRTGAENAAANSAIFAEKLAALTGGRVIYFPKGEYYFSEPLTVNKAEIGLRGDYGTSVLRAADGFTGSSLISVTANYGSVKYLTLQGVEGPAISVSGCMSFITCGNQFKDVAGTIDGAGGKYPISAVNVTYLEVYGNVSTASPTPYAGNVYLGGTCTKTPKCEPNASEVNIFVNEGETLDFYAALNRTCYQKSDLKGQKVVKLGFGTLIATNDLASKTGSYFLGMDVAEGVLRACCDYDFGYKDYGTKDPLYVRSGATVRLANKTSSIMFNNRVVHLAGSGLIGEPGALVCEGHAEGNISQYRIDADAVVATTFTEDYSLCFQSGETRSNCDFQGHTLTLRGADGGKGFRFVNKFQMRGTGRLIVDGVYLGQASKPVVNEPNTPPASIGLTLENGATFRPRTQDFVSLFTDIEVDATSKVWGGEASAAAFDMTIGGWAGAGSVDAGISSLTITNSFKASADDLLAGHCLNALCPITFADGVRMTLENAAALEVGDAPYLCAVSEASLTGLPVRAPGCRFRGWAPESGEDGKSLLLGRIGMLLFLR